MNYSLTNTSSNFIRWNHAAWVAPFVINIVLTIMTLWIILSLVHYGIKTKKWSRMTSRNSDKLNGGIVYTSTIVCSVMSLLRVVSSMGLFNVGFGNGRGRECEVVSDVSITIYSFTIFSFYVFLWLRQRIFYSNEMLSTNFSRTLRFFSAGSIIIIFLAGLGANIAFVAPTTFPSTEHGCSYVRTNGVVYWAACGAAVVFGEVVLFGLFIYPLQRNFNWRRFLICRRRVSAVEMTQQRNQECNEEKKAEKQSNNDVTCKSVNMPKSSRSARRVREIMRRTCIFFAITIVTDLAIFVLSDVFRGPDQRRFLVTLYDLNMFLNLVFIICSFLTYKAMLTSPLRHHKAATSASASSTNQVQSTTVTSRNKAVSQEV